MSKERLEFLKEAVDNAKFIESLPKNWIINIEWLIEQAEKVEEYKEIIEMTGENYELEQETNKRYREALEFYANRENYNPKHYDPNSDNGYMSTIDYDEGEKARQTLARVSNE